MCKKTCYKSSIAVDKNDDYKNVCINSNDYRANIYEFCDKKMVLYNQKLLAYCKLDMCNLCCVGMDKIKNKNFSVSNLKRCFEDCSSGNFPLNKKFYKFLICKIIKISFSNNLLFVS